MNIADPKYLEHLRNLPSSYLLDILVENDDADSEIIRWVLQERGLSGEKIEHEIVIRQKHPWRRSYALWSVARWLTIMIALLVSIFNFFYLFRLINDDHIFKVPLLFLAVGSVIVGFFIGFKLTTHIYHGSKSHLYCGFPFPVGLVDLKTGEGVEKPAPVMQIMMAMNALVGVSLALFPLLIIYISMN